MKYNFLTGAIHNIYILICAKLLIFLPLYSSDNNYLNQYICRFLEFKQTPK